MRSDKRPEKRGAVLVTAQLMGDPKPSYARAEMRQDEGRSAPACAGLFVSTFMSNGAGAIRTALWLRLKERNPCDA